MRSFFRPALLGLVLGAGVAAQSALSGWHRDGQTWLVWNDTGVSFNGVESWSIHRAPVPFTSLADVLAAERIGQMYPFDCKAERLHASAPGSTWTIPHATAGTYTLAANESLFVYTPHAAVPEYFAVLKTDGTTYTALSTPIVQTVGGVKPHVQHWCGNRMRVQPIRTSGRPTCAPAAGR
jgi:hypothetical protein